MLGILATGKFAAGASFDEQKCLDLCHLWGRSGPAYKANFHSLQCTNCNGSFSLMLSGIGAERSPYFFAHYIFVKHCKSVLIVE